MPKTSKTAPPGNETPLIGAVESGIVRFVRTIRLPRVRKLLLGARSTTPPDYGAHLLLSRLEASGPSRLSALAEELAVDVSTLSRQVAHAESLNLVAKRTDTSDRRAILLSLTPKGQRTLDRIRDARLRALSQILRHWPHEDLERFASLLDRCSDDLLNHAQPDERPSS